MNTVTLPPRQVSLLNKKPVTTVTSDIVVETECMFRDSQGKFIGAYLPNIVHSKSSAEIFYNLKYAESARLSGIGSSSLIFGSAPRDGVKRLPARKCQFNRLNPEAFVELCGLGELASDTFSNVDFDSFLQHCKSANKIAPYWFMPDIAFTSGIINNANKLIYHTDNGNMPGCYSMMYTFRKGIDGGYLHLPEFNTIIKNEHNSLLIFDGANVLHGVTPFRKMTSTARRITIVYYVLEKMAKCCADEQSEVKQHNKRLTEIAWLKHSSQ